MRVEGRGRGAFCCAPPAAALCQFLALELLGWSHAWGPCQNPLAAGAPQSPGGMSQTPLLPLYHPVGWGVFLLAGRDHGLTHAWNPKILQTGPETPCLDTPQGDTLAIPSHPIPVRPPIPLPVPPYILSYIPPHPLPARGLSSKQVEKTSPKIPRGQNPFHPWAEGVVLPFLSLCDQAASNEGKTYQSPIKHWHCPSTCTSVPEVPPWDGVVSPSVEWRREKLEQQILALLQSVRQLLPLLYDAAPKCTILLPAPWPHAAAPPRDVWGLGNARGPLYPPQCLGGHRGSGRHCKLTLG